jgi:predicted amidophosphoribosyltransferase
VGLTECPVCRQELNGSSVFCRHCGAKQTHLTPRMEVWKTGKRRRQTAWFWMSVTLLTVITVVVLVGKVP